MIPTNATAARGTALLVFSQGCFLLIGYFVVVLLAREFGPVIYGSYGVIMSVLIWMEQSGARAIPSATAKLLAETVTERAALERSAVSLNIGLYVVFFIALWWVAPWLESRFEIANGTFLFRLAALDLPLFGAYTAYQAIHQGSNHFSRLAITQVAYAAAKLVGVLAAVQLGISLEAALVVNAAATLIGLLCLLPGTALPWQGARTEKIRLLISVGTPMGVYHVLLPLRNWLLLWTLQMMTADSEKAAVGVFVAAWNIAKVPSLAITQVTTVILPSLSKAYAANNIQLARRYVHQALRFGLMLYLPICLVLMSQPDALMEWIYSSDFSGGGTVLSLLVLGEALRVLHAIVGTVLNAAGEARKAAFVTFLSFVPYLMALVVLIPMWGGIGAAVSNALILAASSVVFSILIWNRFGSFLDARSAWNIGLGGCLMFVVFAILFNWGSSATLAYAGGLIVYFGALVVLHEITRTDFALFLPWMRVEPNEPSRG